MFKKIILLICVIPVITAAIIIGLGLFIICYPFLVLIWGISYLVSPSDKCIEYKNEYIEVKKDK